MTTRRRFLAANLIGAAGLAASPARLFSQSQTEAAGADPHSSIPRSERDFWNDWPDWMKAEIHLAREKRLAALAQIKSATQAQERASWVRAKLWDLLGGRPERTPLNAQVTGRLDQGAFRIENILFESFPGVHVTANLYLPATGKPPYPAILSPVGHSDNGKAYHGYQHLYQNLARKGYVVLTYDPFGQGERLQFIDPKTGRSLYGPTGEHLQAGRPMVLSGENLALYFAWDGIRGLDYLVSRPEVDATRLACTGQSGGGTMTMYLSALEPRLKAAVVCEGNTENVAEMYFDPPGSTDDAEQNIVGSLPLGIDRGDLLLAFAPKPLLVCYTTHDEGATYTPVYEEGNKDIFRELQRTYALFGRKDRTALYATHLPHGMDYFLRVQIYQWFNKWLDNPGSGIEEASLDVIPEARLHATRTGQVATSLHGRSVVQLNADRAQVAIRKSPFHGRALDGASRSKAQAALTELLAMPAERSPLRSKVLSTNRRPDAVIEEIQFESEPGLRVPCWFLTPARPAPRKLTVLYLSEDSGDGAVAEPGSLDRLIAAGHSVCAITLRGLVLTTPRLPRGGPLYYLDGSVSIRERYSWTSLALGKSVVGQRVWDTLRALDFLATRIDPIAGQVRIIGSGGAAIPALFASFLDSRVHSVLLNRMLLSYQSLVASETYSLDLEWFVPGILRNLDLPKIACGLTPRSCWMLNTVGPDGEALEEAEVRAACVNAASASSLPAAMRIRNAPDRGLQDVFLEWLEEA